MFTAQVEFGNSKNEIDLIELTNEYLISLFKSGQLWGADYILVKKKNGVCAYLSLPNKNSHKREFHSRHGRSLYFKIIDACGKPPSWSILGSNNLHYFDDWTKAKSLYLYIDMFDFTSPVKNGETGHAIPTYLLSLSDKESEEIFFWASAYRAHDKIYIDSADLEIEAYKQMADINCGLATKGRILCKIIEDRTKIPTYYYLHKNWGRLNDQGARCSSCGNNWEIKKETMDFWEFPLRCLDCRLVSPVPIEINDELATIGEYKAK